jgi:D-gamma-glutamyl-meso-diaminopimelic acid endopeptidase CwlS
MYARGHFVKEAERHHGRFYIWGGDDPSGFDCSGLVVECLKAVGRLKGNEDLSADGLWHRFKAYKVERPREGCMIFWFNDGGRATHTAIAIDEEFCFTADGGGSRVRTMQDAIKYNAFIKTRPIMARSSMPRFVDIFTGS